MNTRDDLQTLEKAFDKAEQNYQNRKTQVTSLTATRIDQAYLATVIYGYNKTLIELFPELELNQ